MKKRVLLSVVAFSAFSLFGPLIQATCLPAYNPSRGYGYIGRQAFELVVLAWPAIMLSIGKDPPSRFNLIKDNLILFATFGALVGIPAKRATGLVATYVVTCVLLSGLEAWFSGFHITHLNWLALGAAFLLYAIPFGVVLRYTQGSSKELTATTHRTS